MISAFVHPILANSTLCWLHMFPVDQHVFLAKWPKIPLNAHKTWAPQAKEKSHEREKIAQSKFAQSTEQLAQCNLHTATCTKQLLARSYLRRAATCTKLLAQSSYLHEATCTERSAACAKQHGVVQVAASGRMPRAKPGRSCTEANDTTDPASVKFRMIPTRDQTFRRDYPMSCNCISARATIAAVPRSARCDGLMSGDRATNASKVVYIQQAEHPAAQETRLSCQKARVDRIASSTAAVLWHCRPALSKTMPLYTLPDHAKPMRYHRPALLLVLSAH